MIQLNLIDAPSFSTRRTDKWWLEPILLGVFFAGFATYSLLVVLIDFENGFIENTHYVSPFYGPEVPDFISWPIWLPMVFFTLWAPFGFRGTCYYMRRVYYRSFFASPPACAVEGLKLARGKVKGESKFPWILNNFHRYFLYAAILLGAYHWIEAFRTTSFTTSSGGSEFGIGVGTILAFTDAIFLTLYITSCHAFRHLLGGGVDRQGSLTNRIWSGISKLNGNHGRWFWLSMASIFVWDLYIRLLARGIIPEDMRLI